MAGFREIRVLAVEPESSQNTIWSDIEQRAAVNEANLIASHKQIQSLSVTDEGT